MSVSENSGIPPIDFLVGRRWVTEQEPYPGEAETRSANAVPEPYNLETEIKGNRRTDRLP